VTLPAPDVGTIPSNPFCSQGLSFPTRSSIPRSAVFISRIGPQRDAKGIAERLRRHRKKGTQVSADDLDAISQAIGALGFSFGFVRPVVFGLDASQARKAASCVARILTRGLEQRRLFMGSFLLAEGRSPRPPSREAAR